MWGERRPPLLMEIKECHKMRSGLSRTQQLDQRLERDRNCSIEISSRLPSRLGQWSHITKCNPCRKWLKTSSSVRWCQGGGQGIGQGRRYRRRCCCICQCCCCCGKSTNRGGGLSRRVGEITALTWTFIVTPPQQPPTKKIRKVSQVL